MTELPPLPLITGDLVLETFSHRSLGLDNDSELTTDNQRLIELGRTLLEFAVMRHLYSKRSMVVAADFASLRDDILSTKNYEAWVLHYNLRQKLRYIPSESLDVMSSEETKQLFQAYVGAVVVQCGSQLATNWVTQLIDPDSQAYSVQQAEQETDSRISKRPRSEPATPETPPPPIPEAPPPATPNPTYYGAAQVTNGNVLGPTVPIIATQATPSKSTAKFLPAFNQRCSQQHLQVEYQASNRGSPHAPLWVITCLVNGIPKGEGQGSSKQVAKEAAATQAYYAMGWPGSYGLPS